MELETVENRARQKLTMPYALQQNAWSDNGNRIVVIVVETACLGKVYFNQLKW